MAAGASILDGVHKNKWTLNVQGRKRGGMGAVAEMLGGELVDDDDYEIEKRKDKFEGDCDPALLVVQPDRKRERETERQEFRQERKKMKRHDPIKDENLLLDEKPEKKIELNPLLKIKSKDGSVVFDGSSGGDGTTVLDGRSGGDHKAVAATQDVEKHPKESSAALASKTDEQESSRSGAAAPIPPTRATTGGLLGSLAYEDSSSDADEPAETSSYNYLNLGLQATSPAKVGRPITETCVESKALPYQQTPLWASHHTPAPKASSGSAAKVIKPPAKAPAKAIGKVPGLDTSMKEVSPALAALMAGLDC